MHQNGYAQRDAISYIISYIYHKLQDIVASETYARQIHQFPTLYPIVI